MKNELKGVDYTYTPNSGLEQNYPSPVLAVSDPTGISNTSAVVINLDTYKQTTGKTNMDPTRIPKWVYEAGVPTLLKALIGVTSALGSIALFVFFQLWNDVGAIKTDVASVKEKLGETREQNISSLAAVQRDLANANLDLVKSINATRSDLVSAIGAIKEESIRTNGKLDVLIEVGKQKQSKSAS